MWPLQRSRHCPRGWWQHPGQGKAGPEGPRRQAAVSGGLCHICRRRLPWDLGKLPSDPPCYPPTADTFLWAQASGRKQAPAPERVAGAGRVPFPWP